MGTPEGGDAVDYARRAAIQPIGPYCVLELTSLDGRLSERGLGFSGNVNSRRCETEDQRFVPFEDGNILLIVHVDGVGAGLERTKMATDYDAPRQKETDDVADESLEQLAGRRNDAATAVLDVDDGEELEDFELPGADLSGEEFTVRVVPKQRDEFTCSSCFLVQHSHRLGRQVGDRMICTDCA